jgi:hypothetical protein
MAMAAWVAKRCRSWASASPKQYSSSGAKTTREPSRSDLRRMGTPITALLYSGLSADT